MAERRARVTARRQIAEQVIELSCTCSSPPRIAFRAGQFISIACGTVAGRPERRSYSLASPASLGDRFALVVKLLDGGLGSRFLERLVAGDDFGFTGPMGFFVPDRDHPGDVVFAVTGAGFAPVVPMLYELLARPGGRIHLHWGARKPGDFFYLAWLDALAARQPRLAVTLHLTQPGPLALGACRSQAGRLTAPVLAEAPTLSRPTFYLVGNGDMVRELGEQLIAGGIDRKRQLRSEVFYPASRKAT
jgi:ferredoxin-NADP reductase